MGVREVGCAIDNTYNIGLELSPPPNCDFIDIDSNNSKQKITYVSVCPITTLSDKENIKELKTTYEKTITSLNQEQKRLISIHSQIEILNKKKNKLESQSDDSSNILKKFGRAVAGAIGGLIGCSIIGGVSGLINAMPTSKSSEDVSERDQENLLTRVRDKE